MHSQPKQCRSYLIRVMTLLLLISCNTAQAQKAPSLFFELGGRGGIASLNFENFPLNQENFKLGWSAGLSYFPVDRNNGGAIVLPFMVQGIYGKGKHWADAGLGQTISITTKGAWFFRMPLSAGYRHMNPDKNWWFRVAYCPIVSYLVDFQWEHWFGLSLGRKLDFTR